LQPLISNHAMLLCPGAIDMNGFRRCNFAYLLAAFVLTSVAQAQISFPQPPGYIGSGNSFTADFNGDGKPDLITSEGFLELGNGDGTFTSKGQIGSTPLAVADFNGDGKPDILATVGIGPIVLLLGNGDGTFQGALPIPNAISASIILAADLNGDGLADWVAISGNQIVVYLSQGNGAFMGPTEYRFESTMAPAQTISIGDFNGDHKTDIAISTVLSSPGHNVPGQLIVLLGNGDGTFQAPKASTGVDITGSAAVGDFNGDGKLDVVLGDQLGGFYFIAGNGDGTFRSPVPAIPNAVSFIGAMVAADVNGDGKLDLVIQGATTVAQVYLGKGDGTFSVSGNYVVSFPNAGDPPDPSSPVVADFNGDGKPDIAVQNNILLGNGDGTFQGINLGAIPNLTGPPSAAVVGKFNKKLATPGVAVTSSQVSGTTTQYAVNILSGDGSGKLKLSNTYSMYSPGNQITTGDFNGDGNLDLLILGIDKTSQVWSYAVFLGNGDGTFQGPITSFETPQYYNSSSTSIVVADFNNDKIPDVAIGGISNDSVAVLIGNGDGTFVPPVFVYDGGAPTLVSADFNGDGNADIVAGDALLLGNGNGTFKAATFPSSLFSFQAMFTADVNGDGKPDLIGGSEVALGKGDGSFTIVPALPAGPLGPYTAIGVADLNGDGIPDLLVSYATSSYTTQTGVAAGNGDGTFGPTVGGVPQAIGGISSLLPQPPLVADFNDDSRPDIAFLSLDIISGVGVLLNASPANFALTATALTPASVVAGNATTSTITLGRDFGSAGAVSLSCIGLPTVTSCAFTPSPVTGNATSSTLVVSTSGTTPAGTYPIQVQAVSGTATHVVPLSLVVQNFTVDVTPATQTITAGQTATVSLSLDGMAGFSGAVALTCVVATSGTSTPPCNLSTSSVELASTTPQMVSVSVPTTASTPAATYSVQVQANAGSLAHEVVFSLLVQAASDFSLGGSTSTSQTISPGQAATFSVPLTAIGSFSGTVALACAITPVVTPAPTCTLSSSSVQVSAATPQTVKVIVGTTGPSVVSNQVARAGFVWIAIPCFLAWLAFRRRRLVTRLAMILVIVACAAWSGCGGGGSHTSTVPGTPAGAYTATLTATSGMLTHTSQLQVTVN
jgi:VCBS repeat protein